MSRLSWMRWCVCLWLLGCSRPDAGARRLDAITPEAEEKAEPFVCTGYQSPENISLSNTTSGALQMSAPGIICLDGELGAVLKFNHTTPYSNTQNDGWGRPVRVHCDDVGVYVYSVGADGLSDTEDDLGYRWHWTRSDVHYKRPPRADEPRWTVFGPRGASSVRPPSPVVEDGRVFLPPRHR